MSDLKQPEKIVFPCKPIKATKTDQGYLLIDKDVYLLAKNSGFSMGCGLLFVGVFFSPFVFFVLQFSRFIVLVGNQLLIYLPELLKYVVLLIAGVLIIESVWFLTTKVTYPFLKTLIRIQQKTPLGGGELLLSGYPLRIGETYDFKFFRSSEKTIESKEAGTIEGYLIGIEMVSYTQGTDTMKEEAIFLQELLFKDSVFPIETSIVSYSGKLRIPLDYPPSFEGKTNQIRWIIAVKLNLPGVVVYQSDKFFPSLGLSNFTLIVDPEVCI